MAIITPAISGLLDGSATWTTPQSPTPTNTTIPNEVKTAQVQQPAQQTATTTPKTGVLNQPTITGQTAQDISKSQGTAYSQLATSAANTPEEDYADYNAAGAASGVGALTDKPLTTYLDQATGTVAGQLNTLLSSDSPYIQLAQNKAKDQAASKGLLNSSLAAGAGVKAAVESALPIAQQDAEAYNKFGLQTQAADLELKKAQGEAIVSGFLNQQAASINQSAKNIQNSFDAQMKGLDQQSATALQGLKQSHDKALQDSINLTNLTLQNQQITADKANLLTQLNAQLVNDYLIQTETLMTDPDVLALDKASYTSILNNSQNVFTNSVKFLNNSAGINLNNILDNYFKDYTSTTTPTTTTKPATTTTTTTT